MSLSINEWIDWFASLELCYYSTGFDFKISLQAQRVIGPFAKRAPGRLFTFGALREDAYSGLGAYFFSEKQPKILKFI